MLLLYLRMYVQINRHQRAIEHLKQPSQECCLWLYSPNVQDIEKDPIS